MFIPPQLWRPDSPYLSPATCGNGIVLENVYKTGITNLDLSTTPPTNGCCNDDMIQFGLRHFVSVRPDH